MESENIIKCFKDIDVTGEDFENFARAYAILDQPFVQEILHNWEESMSSPISEFTWTAEDVDLILNTLQTPTSDAIKSDDDDGFEPWTAEFFESVLSLDEKAPSSAEDEFDSEPWSPAFISAIDMLEISTKNAKRGNSK